MTTLVHWFLPGAGIRILSMLKNDFHTAAEFFASVPDGCAREWLERRLRFKVCASVASFITERLSVCEEVSPTQYATAMEVLKSGFDPATRQYSFCAVELVSRLNWFHSWVAAERTFISLTRPLLDADEAYPFLDNPRAHAQYGDFLHHLWLLYTILLGGLQPVGIYGGELILSFRSVDQLMDVVTEGQLFYSHPWGFRPGPLLQKSMETDPAQYALWLDDNRQNRFDADAIYASPVISVVNGFEVKLFRHVLRRARNGLTVESCYLKRVSLTVYSPEITDALLAFRRGKIENTFASLRQRAQRLALAQLGLKKL